MKVVFMGKPDFSVPALRRLIKEHKVVCVYTREPKISGRGNKLNKTPVHLVAEEYGIEVRTPKTLRTPEEQQEFARLICTTDKQIIFCTGKAGTGKTFCALATALQLKVLDKQYDHIIYSRNPVQLGEAMGFLPGDISDKFNPFMGGLTDNLESISRASALKPHVNDLKSKIDIVPIAFLRGRSFSNTILIIDEAQNLDLTTLKAVLTRFDDYSKIILMGSMNQIDDPKQARKDKCDFLKVIEALADEPYVGTVELVQSMRSAHCVRVDELLGQIK